MDRGKRLLLKSNGGFMDKLYPAGHRVLVRPNINTDEKTSSGLIYKPQREVDKENRATTKGTVVEVGSTAWKAFRDGSAENPWCKIGDVVRFAQYAGVEIEEGDDKFRMINDEDIWGVYKENGSNG